MTHPQYKRLVPLYLREYQQPHLSSQVADFRDRPQILTDPVDTLVLLDKRVLRNPEQSKDFQTLVMPSGTPLRYLNWSPDQQLQVTTDYVKLLSLTQN